MEIKINFTKEEKIIYLERNNYKVESHRVPSGWFSGSGELTQLTRNKEFAVPNSEDFDESKHFGINETFGDLIKGEVDIWKTSLLSKD
jgi:hypothetical protein